MITDPTNPPTVWPFGRLTLLNVAKKVTELVARLDALEKPSNNWKPEHPEPKVEGADAVEPVTVTDPSPYTIKERAPGWFDVISPEGDPVNISAMRRGQAEIEAMALNGTEAGHGQAA